MNALKLFFYVVIGTTLIACKSQNTNQHSSETEYLLAYNVAMNADQSDYDVWTVDPKTGEKTNVTNNADVAWTYQAVEDKILLISDRDTCNRCFYLYEMDADGSNLKQITDFQLRDSWMDTRMEGNEIIVNPSSKVDSVFYIINRNGAVLKKVKTGLAYSSDPVFSPDGEQIAFRGANKKSKREPGFDEAIYLLNVDGTGLKKLTNYPKSDTTAAWYAYKAGTPKWHPTDDFITYQSFQKGKYSLYAVSTDGQKQWKLTENTQDEGWHDWSPDGKWLAIELFDNNQSQFHIGLMNWETKEMNILTDTSYQYQQSPVFVLKK